MGLCLRTWKQRRDFWTRNYEHSFLLVVCHFHLKRVLVNALLWRQRVSTNTVSVMDLSEITAFCGIKGTNPLSLPYIIWSASFFKVYFSKICCKSLKVMTFYDFFLRISGKTFISYILKKLSQKQRLGAEFYSSSRRTDVSRRLKLDESIEPCWFDALICRMLTADPSPSPFTIVEETKNQRGEAAHPRSHRKVTARIRA